MHITIIVPDRIVLCNTVPVHLPDLDWERFNGDPSSPWDNIRAVQFNLDRGQGHVEYEMVQTRQVARHDIKPPDWMIGQADFDANFAWVLPLYDEGLARLQAEQEAETAQHVAESEAMVQRVADETPQAADKDAEIAALKAQIAALDQKVTVITESAIEVAGGGT